MSEKEFLMQEFIEKICNEIGPRLGTYENEKKAGLEIKDILSKVVDTVEMEDFNCHQKGFLEFTKVAFVSMLIATLVFYWFPIISMILAFYAFSTFLLEFLLLKEYVDFLFPKRTGTNIIAKIKPLNERKKIVIVSGHHDSAYEFPLFEKYKEKFNILAYLVAGLVLISGIVSLIEFLLDILDLSLLGLTIIFIAILVASLILGGYIAFNLHSKNVILGANDNLSGVAVMLALAHHFSSHRLKHIELWCISFSCEECMRGSKRFVERHKNELKNSHTINFDMVGRGNISIIRAEPAYLTKHSVELAKDFQESSKRANLELPIKVAGFGGTDAAFFSKAKLKAISILGLTSADYPDTWHELSDTPENIIEECLDKTLNVSIQYLNDLDSRL